MEMQQQQERPPPPAYTQHEPETLHLPSVPTHNLPGAPANGRLPGIRSLDLPDAVPCPRTHTLRPSVEFSPKPQADSSQWGALPPLSSATFPRVPEGLPRSSAEIDTGSPMDTASVVSGGEDSGRKRETSVLSMDDPDVRLAAEALSGLGNPGMSLIVYYHPASQAILPTWRTATWNCLPKGNLDARQRIGMSEAKQVKVTALALECRE